MDWMKGIINFQETFSVSWPIIIFSDGRLKKGKFVPVLN
jgi:hypothetical protein